MFRRGTLNGLMGMMPIGGHTHPSSFEGTSLIWKKAQKKVAKKQISLRINSVIPSRNPVCTCEVCFPINVASRMMSRHHCDSDKVIITVATISNLIWWKWNQLISPIIVNMELRAHIIGHGLNSTKWKGS